jgi:heat shock protein beta
MPLIEGGLNLGCSSLTQKHPITSLTCMHLMQAMGDNRSAEYMRGRRIMEINPDHPIIVGLKEKVELESRGAPDQVKLLFEAACLTGGFNIESPKDFAARIYTIMGSGSGSSASSGEEIAKEVEAEVV